MVPNIENDLSRPKCLSDCVSESHPVFLAHPLWIWQVIIDFMPLLCRRVDDLFRDVDLLDELASYYRWAN